MVEHPSQFLSPLTNKRTDEFGGSVENRTRFCRMVIEEVRKQVRPFFPIMLRLSADELMEGGNTLEDTLEYLEYEMCIRDRYTVTVPLKFEKADANFVYVFDSQGTPTSMSVDVQYGMGKTCLLYTSRCV